MLYSSGVISSPKPCLEPFAEYPTEYPSCPHGKAQENSLREKSDINRAKVGCIWVNQGKKPYLTQSESYFLSYSTEIETMKPIEPIERVGIG